MSLQSQDQELNQMILNGKILEAFDKFYADDVVMQEDSDEPRRGKDANRAYEEQFVSSIQDFHGGEVRSVAYNEEDGVTTSEWFMDISLEGQGRQQMEQVAVRRWENGKVKHERFYHAG